MFDMPFYMAYRVCRI